MVSSHSTHSIPPDITEHERVLIESKKHIQNLGNVSDGLFLNAVGLDAILGFIPFVGGVYTAAAGAWMVLLGRKVNAPSSDMIAFSSLIVVDILMGVFPIFGDIPDAFFRVHGWYSGKLIKHVDEHLSIIGEAKHQTMQGISVDFNILRHKLFGIAIPAVSKKN